MEDTIGISELKDMLQSTLRARINDLHPAELDAFVSGLVSTVGLRVVNLAFDARHRGEPVYIDSFRSSRIFDFDLLPLGEIVSALDANSGLGLDACEAGLSAIEEEVIDRLRSVPKVTIDRLGTISKVGEGYYELQLDPELKIVDFTSG
jgi:hypothetical protein